MTLETLEDKIIFIGTLEELKNIWLNGRNNDCYTDTLNNNETTMAKKKGGKKKGC